jgi:hypothetical protein
MSAPGPRPGAPKAISKLLTNERPMGFVQIVEFTTPDLDAVRQMDAKWQEATDGKRTARRQIVTRDRNNLKRYLVLVFFDSYDSAMQNSNPPETQAFAEQHRAATNELGFHDLDVISDEEL